MLAEQTAVQLSAVSPDRNALNFIWLPCLGGHFIWGDTGLSLVFGLTKVLLLENLPEHRSLPGCAVCLLHSNTSMLHSFETLKDHNCVQL